MANALIAIGILLSLTGLGFVAMYVHGAILDRLGEPDQSLIYWYLPILFIGLGIASAGISLFRSGLRRKRGRPAADDGSPRP